MKGLQLPTMGSSGGEGRSWEGEEKVVQVVESGFIGDGCVEMKGWILE